MTNLPNGTCFVKFIARDVRIFNEFEKSEWNTKEFGLKTDLWRSTGSLKPTFLTVTSVKANFGGGMVKPICDSSHNLVKAVCWLWWPSLSIGFFQPSGLYVAHNFLYKYFACKLTKIKIISSFQSKKFKSSLLTILKLHNTV